MPQLPFENINQPAGQPDPFAAFIAQTTDIFVAYDANLRYLAINPTGAARYGLTPAAIIGRTNQDVLGPQADVIDPLLATALETGEKVLAEYELTFKQQRYTYDAIYTPMIDPQTGAQQVWGICRDITARQPLQAKREALLKQQTVQIEERFRTSFHEAAIAKALMALDGSWVQVNAALCQLLGYPQSALLNRDVVNLTHPEDRELDRHQIRQLLIGQISSYQIEKRYIHQLGHPISVLLSVALVHNSQGQPAYFIAEMQDITQRKQTEAALYLQLQKTLQLQTALQAKNQALQESSQAAQAANLAKSEFLAMISHEIRTPMNAVIGMTDLLQDTVLSSHQQDFVETIRTSGEALLNIINDILDFSKVESGKLQLELHPFPLATCVEEALDIVNSKATAKGLELAYFIEPGTPNQIQGDMNRLRQILVNLLSNAVKFTHQGEVILTVTARDVATAEMTPSVPLLLHELLFAVRDTGIGIAPHHQQQLFQSFCQLDSSITRQYGGTGLGLAISKQLCELMGGTIWVESQVGQGSTFFFTIAASALPSTEAEQAKVEPLFQGKRILIVEDQSSSGQILSRQVQSWGMHPTLAASGAAALALEQQEFDVAIADLQLPDLTGQVLVAGLRHHHAIPIIGLSTLGGSAAAAWQYSPPLAAFLNKPVKQFRLYQALLKVLQPPFAGPIEAIQPSAITQPISKSPLPLKILVAEDNLVNQKVILRLLDRLGYQADLAHNGLEVLSALRHQHYDVVLMDVQMPEMDGLTTAQNICREWDTERPRIVAMTANTMAGDRESYLAAGMDDYIAKPIRLKGLERVLAQSFHQHDPN
ncbi:response regulator [Acaryochloris sp. IP29b_bin.148]|uniref:response regulator n=1 Tax=Acaryochloris sp. IP29b_bin.148 TaxID=2969218 RepID=UPI002615F05D|nr:response regulator [Acaryochloris sp. IP29b_bin.148]